MLIIWHEKTVHLAAVALIRRNADAKHLNICNKLTLTRAALPLPLAKPENGSKVCGCRASSYSPPLSQRAALSRLTDKGAG